MASTLESQNTEQYVDFDEYIEYQLQRTRGSIKSTDILTAFAYVSVFILTYLLLFVIGDHWLVEGGFSQTARIVLLSMVGVLSASWLAWKVLWPYLRQVNALFAAKAIERAQPELRSTLLNLIDARSSGKELSPAILSAMEKRAALSMSQTNVDEAVDRRPLMWACYTALGLVVLFTLYTLFTPKKVSASVWRALFPASSVEAPTETVIEDVSPGDVEVIPGTRLEVLADISGQVPEKVTLYYSTADREFVNEPIEMREDPDMPRRYRAQIIGTNGEGIQQDLNYYVQAGDDHSARYAVTVFQPPTADIVELHYAYPEYMEREAKTREAGNIDDYEGVIVTFLAEGNMPLKSATITFHDDQGTNFRAESLPMQPVDQERTRFRASWVLSIRAEDGIYPRYYTIECKNERGVSDPNPTRWPIRIHPDRRPEVNILNPKESEIERPANAVLPLTAFASDDFKVKSLVLWKQLDGQPAVKHRVLFEGAEASLSVDYDWRLNENWPLKVGDKVFYWVEAQDNRTPDAGKRNTDKYVVLIRPEQSEENVQRQLESDRREQEQPPKNNDPSEKNADDPRQKDNPRPQEGMEEEQPQKNQPQENQPQENQPQQENQSQDGEESQMGEKGSSGEKGGAGDPSNAQKSEEGKGEKGSKQPGAGESVKKDGSEDGKALESLHRHINQNPPEPGEENQNPETGNNEQNDQTTEKSNDPAAGKPDQKTEGNDTKPENTGEPKPGEEASQKPEGTEKGTENQPSESPMPKGQENAPAPMKNQPGSEAPEKTKNEPGDTKTGEDPARPGKEKQPEPGANPPEPKTSEGQDAKGGSDQNTGEGTPSNPNDPSAAKPKKGTGGNETQPDEGGKGGETEKPLKGSEKPAAPDKNAQKREATGEEKGPATTEEDPNPDAKPANNNLKRTDPEQPANTRKREGDPNEVSPEQMPKESPEGDPKTPDKTKPGSENPNAVDPQKTTRPDTNPDERTGQTPEADPMKKPAPAENQPNAGDDELKGRGRPKGQQAKKPEGGEGGSSKQEEQGTPGSKEKGPGDQTPRPGETDPAEKPQRGKPGEESGEGTRTRPTERTENAPPREGMPTEGTDQTQAPPSDHPGQEASPNGERQPGQPAEQFQPGKAGPPDVDQNRPAKPMTPEAAQAAEEANLEYGRQATDLALKKLENELKRGEVNEEWLKEMGWDKADAAGFLDRMKDRMNRDENSPEAQAQKRQFNEWLKRLNKPAGKTIRRTGESVKGETARDLIDARRAAPPAELRDLYDAYRRGISERSQ